MPESLHRAPRAARGQPPERPSFSVGQDANERDDPGLTRKLRLTSSVALLGVGEGEAGVRFPGPGGGVTVAADSG
jgi:hypothetical protein